MPKCSFIVFPRSKKTIRVFILRFCENSRGGGGGGRWKSGAARVGSAILVTAGWNVKLNFAWPKDKRRWNVGETERRGRESAAPLFYPP